MIIAKLMGNQMFQYAAARRLAHVSQVPPRLFAPRLFRLAAGRWGTAASCTARRGLAALADLLPGSFRGRG